jgi:hypothetical protein
LIPLPSGTSGTIIKRLRPVRLHGDDVETVDGDAGVVMAKLIYASNMSLDGCTEDERGAFDWAPPDDELALFVWPVVLGGRNPALPTDSRVDLELIDEHRFGSGVVYVRYHLR